MKAGAGVALTIASLTLLTYFQFPGHTYLQQDTQIYVPILEHLWDSSVLTQDILVQHPHVSFTLYDELALLLRWLTGIGFHGILTALQIVARGLGFWGVYLIALSLLGDRARALLVMAVCGLGAAIDGPAVLVVEYEPTPRALAIPLVFLAIGLMFWRRPVWAGSVAAIGFVLHPPSLLAFWMVYLCVERRLRAWAPLAIATAVLMLAASAQPGLRENQPFLYRITPELEYVQRLRASYGWVTSWWRDEWWKHALAAMVVATGFWRVRRMGAFLVGLPVLGVLSVPLSDVLLDHLRLGAVLQVQPARTLLFVTAFAVLVAGVCGCLAVKKDRWFEAFGWFSVAMVPPLAWGHWWLAGVLGAALVVAAKYRWVSAPLVAACYFAIPMVGHVSNYPALHTLELEGLSEWARRGTPRDAVFFFPGAGKKPDAGIFRSEALRAIYVDWKGGGQVNYLPELGVEWWERWEDVMMEPIDLTHYWRHGIDYAVVDVHHQIGGAPEVYRNGTYVVYLVPAKSP